MDDAVRSALVELCRTHGTAMLDDPAKLEAFLCDTCPGSKREIHCLVSAAREGAVVDLRAADSWTSGKGGVPTVAGVQRLAERLHTGLGFDRDAAAWTAQTIAAALAPDAAPIAVAAPGRADLVGDRRSSSIGAAPKGRPGVVSPSFAPAGAPAKGRRWLWLGVGVATAACVVGVVLFAVNRKTDAAQSSRTDRSDSVTISPGGPLSLKDALERVAGGGTVKLRAGTYKTPSLSISSSVKLVGEGAERTRVVFPVSRQPGLGISGPKSAVVSVSGIGFGLSGKPSEYSGDVVSVGESTRAEFLDCRFESGGHGIRVNDSGRLTLKACEVSGTYWSGIGARDRSRLTVVDSSSIDSAHGRGLFAEERARIVVRRGTFTGNFGEGLITQGSTRVAIIGGVFSENQHSGIAAQGRSRVDATGVTASGNALVAIGFSQYSTGMAEDCHLTVSGEGSLSYPCIAVNDDANADCIGNTCNNSLGFGISYEEHATGRALGNDCSRCRWAIRRRG